MTISDVLKNVPKDCECLSLSVVYVDQGLSKQYGWKVTNPKKLANIATENVVKNETKRGCRICDSGIVQGANCFCKIYLQSINVNVENELPDKYAVGDWVVNNGCGFFRRTDE